MAEYSLPLMDELFETVIYGEPRGDWRKMPETEAPDDGESTSLARMIRPVAFSNLSKLLMDDKAAEAHPSPSQAQIEAGNYRKGHLDIGSLSISIENPAGSRRRPEWPELNSHYGYIRGTIGKDGDHVDCFVRPQTSHLYDGKVFIVNQTKADGSFDEHKCMIGWPNEKDATDAYLENYINGWNRIHSVIGLPFAEFEDWIKNGNHKTIKENTNET